MSRKTRLWESFKTLLIVLLSLSALFLLSRSPLVQSSGLTDLLGENLTSTSGSSASSGGIPAAAVPARLAAGSGKGLYGVQYDFSAADALFDQAAPLLGEALSLAQAPQSITEAQWQARLSGSFLWFDYTSPVPLSALCAWLEGSGENEALTASARCILLAEETDGTLSLCYRTEEDGGWWSCATTLDASLHLTPILSGVNPNGAFFAFQDETLPAVTDPYTLFTGGEPAPAVYASSTPSLPSGSEQTTQFLSALAFSDQNRADVSDGVLYVDGEDTLRLTDGGCVLYSSSGSGKYPAGEGLAGAVEAAWPLAEVALGPLCGSARLCLFSARENEEEGSYTVAFGYMLDGSEVRLYDQGWAASFLVRDGSVQEFTLYLRTYTDSGETQLLLPAEKAAAALTALTDTTKELVIQYRDTGASTTTPGWKAR